MGTTSTEKYEGIAGAIQLVAAFIGKLVGGKFGVAYATLLTAQNAWVASIADLAAKVKNDTAKTEDFMDVASKTISTLAALGFLTATVGWSVMKVASGIGLVLMAWKEREFLKDTAFDVWGKLHTIYKELTEDEEDDTDTDKENEGGIIIIDGGSDKKVSDGAGGSGGGNGADGGPGDAGGRAGTDAAMPRYSDPLVLDLDGDGIETTRTRNGAAILFDHDADGVKTGSAWVNSDDGWLVLDRNGNGTIDSGRELFGNHTQSTQCHKAGQEAANGLWSQAA